MSKELEQKIKHLQESYDKMLLEVFLLEQKLDKRDADIGFYKRLLDDCIEAMKVDANRIEELTRGKA